MVVPPAAAAAAVAAAIVVVPGRAPAPVAAQKTCQLSSSCCKMSAQNPRLLKPYCLSHATSLALMYHCRWSQDKRPILQPGGLLTSGRLR